MLNKITFFIVLLLTSECLFSQTENSTLIQEGLNLSKEKKSEQAIEVFHKVLKQQGSSPDVAFYLGNAYFDVQQYDQAILFYSEVLRIKPATKDALFNRGNAYYQLKEYGKSI